MHETNIICDLAVTEGTTEPSLEIIRWRFGYRPKYQQETPLSAIGLILRAITQTACYNIFLISTHFDVQKCKLNRGLA